MSIELAEVKGGKVCILRSPSTPYILNPKPVTKDTTVEKTSTDGVKIEIVQTIDEYLHGLTALDKHAISIGGGRLEIQAKRRIEELYKPVIENGEIPDTADFRSKVSELGFRDIDHFRKTLFFYLRHALCHTDWEDDPAIAAHPMCYEAPDD